MTIKIKQIPLMTLLENFIAVQFCDQKSWNTLDLKILNVVYLHFKSEVLKKTSLIKAFITETPLLISAFI